MGMRFERGTVHGRSLSRTLWRNLEALPSPEQTERLIARETARAERNGLQFSLCLFRVRRGGRVGTNERRLALTLLRRVRLTDEVGWFGNDFLCALLPDTTGPGAQAFADSVCDVVGLKGPRPATRVYAYPEDWNLVPTPDNHNDTNGEPQRHAEATGHGPRQHVSLLEGFGTAGDIEFGAVGMDIPAQAGRFNAAGHGKRHDLHKHANGHSARRAPAHKPAADAASEFRAGATGVAVAEAVLTEKAVVPQDADLAPVEPLRDLLARPMPLWKRVIDVTAAGLLLSALSPLLLAVAAVIRLTSQGPAIFKQRRAGLGGRPFTIYKFRTMCTDAEAKQKALRKLSEQDGPAFKLTNDPRITKIGKLLRKTSIDELPQLINVIKGNMSLVGPRPLPLHEADGCETWQKRRLDVTPGLTCIWQIEGRNEVTFAEWVRMDVKYMRRRTMFHDLSILFRTVPAVLMRRGAR